MSQALPLAVLAGCFAFFAAWEAGDPLAPFANPAARRRHIARNLALFLILFALANGLLLVADRFAPLPYDGAADGIAARLSGSLAVQCVLGLVLLDLSDYAFHRVCHRVPILWRLHRVHHAEAQLDVSTAMRFHPLETLLGISVRIGLLAGLGLPLWIEAVRAVVVNPLALAQHANVRLPSCDAGSAPAPSLD
jgi:sterol desaturase/sphingolipid hydroxylase (fatty acid hydroxylase superfamily)